MYNVYVTRPNSTCAVNKHAVKKKSQWRELNKVLNLLLIEKVLLTEKYNPLIWSVLDANSITNKYKIHKSFSFTL